MESLLNLALAPGAAKNTRGLHRTTQELQAKLEGNQQAKGAAADKLELDPGAIRVNRVPGNKHGLHRTNQELHAKLDAIRGKHQPNKAAASKPDLVPGAVPLNKAPGNKHGLNRTNQELQAKLDAVQGKHQPNRVAAIEGATAELVPGAGQFSKTPGNKHGLHRTNQELRAKLDVIQGHHAPITSHADVAYTAAEEKPLQSRGLRRTPSEREAKMHAKLGRTSATNINYDTDSQGTTTRAPEQPVSHHCNDSQSQEQSRVTELNQEFNSSGQFVPTAEVPPLDQYIDSDEESHTPAIPQSQPTPSARSPTSSLVRVLDSTSSNQGLVEARLVTNESTMNILQEAQQVDAQELAMVLERTSIKEKKERECRRVGYCLISGSLVILAIFLGVGFTRKPAIVTTAPTVSPSTAPSSVPSSAPTSHLDLLVEDLPDYTQESLQNYGTPQWKAWKWLSHHENITNLPDWRKKQLFALVTFYYSFEGENWNSLIRDYWLDDTKEECIWYSGVFGFFLSTGEYWDQPKANLPCNNLGELTSLDLKDLQLSGLAPYIPPEIALLSSLKSIKLQENEIQMPLTVMLPAELYQMTNLRVLWLPRNSLTGLIPSELGLMTQMTNLDLRENNFSRPLPTELGRMTDLENLQFTDFLTGSIPSEIGFFTSTPHMDVRWKDFSGPLPTELGRMATLELLYLSENSFSGSICSEIGEMTSLVEFIIGDNSFSGTIPSELGQLSLLEWFDLSNLTMMTGPIPSELALMTSLRYLKLIGSIGLSGTIPDELCYLQNSTCTFIDYWYNLVYNCTLDFDCTDILCGCDCPCFNGEGTPL
jgi:hypothetical protein